MATASVSRLEWSRRSETRAFVVLALGVIAYAYIGGITVVSGALFAGLISADALFPHALLVWFGISGTWAIFLAGIALISTLIFSPEGAVGTAYRKRMERTKRVAAGLSPPNRMETLFARASRSRTTDA